jgi:lipopolysaccharide transport system permease protein
MVSSQNLDMHKSTSINPLTSEMGTAPSLQQHHRHGMWNGLRDACPLAWRFFLRDFRAKYRHSILGVLWAAIVPLFLIAMLLVLHRSGIVQLHGLNNVPYVVFIVIGVTIWGLFATTLTACTDSLINAGALISKIQFPRASLLLAQAGMGLVEFAIRIPLVVAIMLYENQFAGFLHLGLGILAMTPLFLFAIATGLVTSVVAALFRDLGFVLPIALGVLMLLSPILYPIPHDSLLGKLNTFNPITHIVETSRNILLGSLSAPPGYWFVTLGILVFLLVAWRFFFIAQRRLAERI